MDNDWLTWHTKPMPPALKGLGALMYNDNWELTWKLHFHWLHHRLSWSQCAVLPMMTKLASWELCFLCIICKWILFQHCYKNSVLLWNSLFPLNIIRHPTACRQIPSVGYLLWVKNIIYVLIILVDWNANKPFTESVMTMAGDIHRYYQAYMVNIYNQLKSLSVEVSSSVWVSAVGLQISKGSAAPTGWCMRTDHGPQWQTTGKPGQKAKWCWANSTDPHVIQPWTYPLINSHIII